MMDICISPGTFLFSVLLGISLGVPLGIVGVHHVATKFAQQLFDQLLVLRRQAKDQMDAYQDSQTGKD